MKREHIFIGGVSSLCLATWAFLLFMLFNNSNAEIDHASTEGNSFNNDVSISESLNENEELTYEEETNENDPETVETDERDGVRTIEQGKNDISSSARNLNNDISIFSKDSAAILERGIQRGDFDDLLVDGVISIDVVLEHLFNN